MTEVTVKRGDAGVLFTDTLKSNGAAVNLTSATVKFILRRKGVTISQTATVVSAVAGTVSYTSVAGDLDVAGDWLQEWEAYYSGTGKRMTFPSNEYNVVHVISDLG